MLPSIIWTVKQWQIDSLSILLHCGNYWVAMVNDLPSQVMRRWHWCLLARQVMQKHFVVVVPNFNAALSEICLTILLRRVALAHKRGSFYQRRNHRRCGRWLSVIRADRFSSNIYVFWNRSIFICKWRFRWDCNSLFAFKGRNVFRLFRLLFVLT